MTKTVVGAPTREADMTYTTDDLPQADVLALVVKAAEAIVGGARTHEEIARAIGGYKTRQGVYYRHAAELLGLVYRVGPGTILPTDYGKELLAKPEAQRKLSLGLRLRQTPVFSELLAFLAQKSTAGATTSEVHGLVATLVPNTTAGMIKRRTSTILSWLQSLELIHREGDRLWLVGLPTPTGIFVTPATGDVRLGFRDLQPGDSVGGGFSVSESGVQYSVDTALYERANSVHSRLVYDMAACLQAVGLTPYYNQYIDLFARSEKGLLFEMKSCQVDSIHSQVRAGVVQLYEYAFLHDLAEAEKNLVLEREPTGQLGWLVTFVTLDRGITLLWSDGHGSFGFPEQCRRLALVLGLV